MPLRTDVAFLTISASLASPVYAFATPSAGPRRDLPAISQLPSSDPPELRPLDLELTPRSFEWTLSGGSGFQACPDSSRCSGPPAWVVSTGVSSRPVNWFSWGINGEVSHRHQMITRDSYQLNHVQRGYSTLLFGRVHWLTGGRSDIYTAFGLGFGVIDGSGSLEDAAHRSFELMGSVAPESDVALGWRWRVSPYLSAGLELHLRYWITPEGARCGTLARRACPFASDGLLPRDTLLWSLQLAGAVGFGQAL